MDLFAFNPADFMSFLLTLIRVSLIVFLLPFFGADSIPSLVKAALSIVLTLTIWPHLSLPAAQFPAHPWNITLVVLGEVVMGLVLGLVVHFIFAGIQTGGQMIGMQMGFSMINLADPLSGNQTTATSHFLYMVAILVFLVLDGHLFILQALAGSFALVPAGGLSINAPLTIDILELSKGMFVLGVKIAAPVMAALLLVELALALMGRAAPQMNLLTMGFPIKIAVGFFFMGLVFVLISTLMETVVIDLGPTFDHLMRVGR